MASKRGAYMDVTNKVDLSSPGSVEAAVQAILRRRYRHFPAAILRRAFVDLLRLYRGEYPGYHACDTVYHDINHVLDVTLAMARLIDGYEAQCPADRAIGSELALVGMLVAMFHDAGYIRRRADKRHSHGAEYTPIHVQRSARYLREYLPQLGLDKHVEVAAKLVHFTGYEITPDRIELDDERERLIGWLVGSADLIAQMSDPLYIEKCRDHLFYEFEIAGINRYIDESGCEVVRYASPEDLVARTPAFVRRTFAERLDGYFRGAYRYAADHFGGRNLYIEGIDDNCRCLQFYLRQREQLSVC